MKGLITLLVAILFVYSGFSQAPEKMSYQAVVRNANDELVKSSPIGMQISILQGSESGTPIYVETHSTSTNINGLATVEIGGGTPVTGTFSDIDWSTGVYFLKTESDPSGGTNYTITGTSQLLSVPYAFHANSAETVSGEIDYTETDPVFGVSNAASITATDIINLGNLSGTNTGDQDISGISTNALAIQDSAINIRAEIPEVISDLDLNANSNKITNLSNPTEAQDAVTKAYVDALLTRIETLEQVVFPPRDGFFTIKNETDELYFIDLENGSISMIGNIGIVIEEGFFGMQYIDHKLYLCKGGDLYTYDLSSDSMTHIIHNDHLAWQFSINSLGELYSVNELSGPTQGSLYKIDIGSNTSTLIGTTGTLSIWGLGFDSSNQLWAVDEFYGTYGTMNLATGKFTQYSSATSFPNLVHTTPDNNGNIYSLHGGTVNGIVKYSISSDLASLIIPLEQGMWLGLAFGKY